MPGQALPPPCTFLNVGQAFTGTQNVSSAEKEEAWKVNVRLQGCDVQHGYLCGSMEALNVPSAETPVVTFWEGEIVDNKNYTFFTGQWDASRDTDIEHWAKFPLFQQLKVVLHLPYQDEVQKDGGRSLDLANYPYMFMDWQAAQIDSRLHLPSPTVCIPKDSSRIKASEPKVQFPSVLKKTPMFGLLKAHILCVGCLIVLCSCSGVVCVSAAAASPGDPTADVLFPYLLQEYLPMYHIFAFLATVLCCAGAVWVGSGMRVGGSRYRTVSRKKLDVSSKLSISGPLVSPSATNGWGGHEHLENYSSMVEELVPEITQHALSYLDYKSLCQVSKTNSAMRRVADDDSAWRALYRKDFSSEQDYVRPRNGWKAHYAVTKAVSRANKKFYQKFKTKSLRGMKGLWLKADYVKCIHPGGELLSGYDVIMENWRIVFNWSQRFDFELEDVRVRVVGDVAWVTAKEFVNTSRLPLLATNCYEYQDGKWFIVHHHSSQQVEGGGPDFGLFL